MLDQYKLFDKNPIHALCHGPTGLGVIQTGFTVPYVAWYDEGIYYVPEAHYTRPSPTGNFISGSDDILHANSLSFAFDKNSQIWAAVHYVDSTSVLHFSDASVMNYSFSGTYPCLAFNSCSADADDRDILCVYTKQGEPSLYSRSSRDLFTTETLLISGLDGAITSLHHARADDYDPKRMKVFGTYSNGDSFSLRTERFEPSHQFITKFEQLPEGPIDAIRSMGDLYRTIDRDLFLSDNMQKYESGVLLSHLTELNKSPSRIIFRDLVVGDHMQAYNTGVIVYLNGGTRMKEGFLLPWQ